MDFIAVSSYANNSKSTGVVRIIKDLDKNITDRHVIIVEDIIDSGLTLQYLTDLFKSRKPASVKTITLLDKITEHKLVIAPNYCGFEIPDDFVVGYGLDYSDYYRNLPYIWIGSGRRSRRSDIGNTPPISSLEGTISSSTLWTRRP